MPPRQYTLWISARKDSGSAWFLGGLALIVIVVPILNLVVPASSAFHISPYGLALIGKYLLANDNNMCGGANVRFWGVWRRAR